MARLKQAKEALQNSYDTFNQAVEKPLPALALSNTDSIQHLLTSVIRRESLAVTKKINFLPIYEKSLLMFYCLSTKLILKL